VLGRPVLVPDGSVVSLGSAIFAFLAAGIFQSVEEAQDKICPQHKVFSPDEDEKPIYERLYGLYSKIYFEFGNSGSGSFAEVLPSLMQISNSAKFVTKQKGLD
jgi:L-ribulokinase